MQLYQITGSSSFAARAALEEAGADYTVVDVHPRNRDELPEFARINPLKRVPALKDGEVMGYDGLSSGGMGQVQRNISQLPEADIQAIAEYIASLR